MNRTRGQFLTSAVVVGGLGVIMLLIGWLLQSANHDGSVLLHGGVFAVVVAAAGALVAWHAPRQ